jgi:hypothetical protein
VIKNYRKKVKMSDDNQQFGDLFKFDVENNETTCLLCPNNKRKIIGYYESNLKRHIITKHPVIASERNITVNKRKFNHSDCELNDRKPSSGILLINLSLFHQIRFHVCFDFIQTQI